MVLAYQDTAGSVSISEMSPRDLEEAVVLSLAGAPFLRPWSERMFIEEMNNPFAFCFLAKVHEALEDPVVGIICFRIIGDESELLHFCVHPGYRRRSVGKEMMTFYVRVAVQRRVRNFYLEVNAENEPAISLYRLFSYLPVGKRKLFYDGGGDAVLMRSEI